MFLTRHLRRHSISTKSSSFRPSLCLLEDRITPSKFFPFLPTPPTPGPATHLVVEAPKSVTVGQQFTVEVEALDANNRVAPSYTGTVAFSLGTTDASAVLPANYPFTATDRGMHFFNVTLTTAESQTIVATDTVTSSITGSAAITVKAAPAATHFLVEAPKYVVAGGPVTVTIVALDQHNRVDTGYDGTIDLTSTDSNATLPDSYTFSPATDHGSHTFQVTFATVASQTLTATDAATSSITGKTTVTVEAANAVTHFGIYTIGPALPGVPTDIYVTALDANNHVVAGYTGSVTFSSSDTSASLPSNYTFQASDDGKHIFAVTFNTPGEQTITATDTVTASITGSADVWVAKKFKFQGWGWFFPW